jgi:hypothetical protein
LSEVLRRAVSLVGRAPPLQGGGRRFDSDTVHHVKTTPYIGWFFRCGPRGKPVTSSFKTLRRTPKDLKHLALGHRKYRAFDDDSNEFMLD